MLTVGKRSGRHVLCSLTISLTPINQIQSNKAQTLLHTLSDASRFIFVMFGSLSIFGSSSFNRTVTWLLLVTPEKCCI